MIEKIVSADDERLRSLDYSDSIEGRILSYLSAYGTSYDFCRFFAADGAVMMNYDGELFVTANDTANGEELALFVQMQGFYSAVMNETAYRLIHGYLSGFSTELVVRMQINDTDKFVDERVSYTDNYKEVFGIISDAFGLKQSSFERWYIDINHRVRHGVSRLLLMSIEGEAAACCVVNYSCNGICFLSHIGVKKKYQQSGLGKAIVNTAVNMIGMPAILECKTDRVGFYEKCGFKKCGIEYEIIADR